MEIILGDKGTLKKRGKNFVFSFIFWSLGGEKVQECGREGSEEGNE